MHFLSIAVAAQGRLAPRVNPLCPSLVVACSSVGEVDLLRKLMVRMSAGRWSPAHAGSARGAVGRLPLHAVTGGLLAAGPGPVSQKWAPNSVLTAMRVAPLSSGAAAVLTRLRHHVAIPSREGRPRRTLAHHAGDSRRLPEWQPRARSGCGSLKGAMIVALTSFSGRGRSADKCIDGRRGRSCVVLNAGVGRVWWALVNASSASRRYKNAVPGIVCSPGRQLAPLGLSSWRALRLRGAVETLKARHGTSWPCSTDVFFGEPCPREIFAV